MPYKDPVVRRAKAREYSKAWKERNPGWQLSLNEKRREMYANDPAYREKVKKVIPKHIHAAHQRVHKAIKRGEIERPETCSQCGQGGAIEAAHENYSERLAIRWLCRSCHRTWDAMNPKAKP